VASSDVALMLIGYFASHAVIFVTVGSAHMSFSDWSTRTGAAHSG
jgi:hypothetical protein